MPKPLPNVPNSVPLALWPCAEASPTDLAGKTTTRHDAVLADIARRVTETYTARGALAAVPLGSPHAAAATAATGRRVVAVAGNERRAGEMRDLARSLSKGAAHLLVVRAGQPNQLRRVLGHDAGAVDLVLLIGLPRAEVRHPALLPTVAKVLRPGGVVAVVVQPSTRGPDLATGLVASATAARLRYLQHIVALLRPAADLAGVRPERGDGRRDVVHADVLVFTRPRDRKETA